MSNTSNREQDKNTFRKIPSLDYLYEIDPSGRYLRNSKSKRVLQQQYSYGYWVVPIHIDGKRVSIYVHELVDEVWNTQTKMGRRHKNKCTLKIVSSTETREFETRKACAEYLCKIYGKGINSMLWKLRQRRARVYDYDISYLSCAETVR